MLKLQSHCLWREFDSAPENSLRAVNFHQGGKGNENWGGRRARGDCAIRTKVVWGVMWSGRVNVKGEEVVREEGRGKEEEEEEQQN